MATVTPSWTDNVSVVAAASLARGSTTRGTIDLRSKVGAFIAVFIGRQGTNALTNGVSVLIRRTVNNDGIINPGTPIEFLSRTTGASSTTVNSDSNSGQAAINVASSAGFSAGQLLCIEASDHSRMEFHRVSKVAAGVVTVDVNLKNSHTSAQADTVRNQADAFTVWAEGGATYEVVFDYGDDSAGESVTVYAVAQTLDSYTSA